MKAALRRYLLSTANLRQVDPNREVFEAFLTQEVEPLFALREAAVVRFRQARWLAKQEKGPLPLTWEEVTETFARKGPRAGLETTLARMLPAVLTQVFDRLRKVLRREREPQAVGRVEQLDAACLRWLTRQPGYSVAQKAGPRQRVLAVVRRENYDILENRVLRDLLLRTERLAERWLEENERAFPGHATVRAVKRLGNLCRRGLELEALQGVAPLHDVPKPNYVLTQDALYRRIWDAYLLVVEHYRLIEGLWDRREKLAEDLAQWRMDAEKYAAGFHRSELWVCPIKNGKPWVEEYPRFTVRKKARAPYWGERAEGGHVTVDLLGLHLSDVLLMPDERHPNAKPRLIDFDAPYVDFRPADEPKHRHRGRYLLDILRERDQRGLAAYFEQLHGAIGGSDWTILVADDWEPDWLEAIKQAASAALGSSNVFLLWRTVAMALGMKVPPEEIRVPRLNKQSEADCAMLEYDENGLPCHRAYRFHAGEFVVPALPTPSNGKSILDWLWGCPTKQSQQTNDLLKSGVGKFWEKRKARVTPYWDELMGLYLVYQTEDEHLAFEPLVKYSKRYPGGKDYSGPLNRKARLDTAKVLNLYVLEAERPRKQSRLQLFNTVLENLPDKAPLELKVSGVPGQGVMSLQINHEALKQPEEVLLTDLQETTDTLVSLEDTLPRSFPPTFPQTIAEEGLLEWSDWEELEKFVAEETDDLVGDLFSKSAARYQSEDELPHNTSKLMLLQRVNVFGAIGGRDGRTGRLPDPDKSEAWYTRLFERLNEAALEEVANKRFEWATRLVAWTYQWDNPIFRELREECVSLIVDGDRSDSVLISLCSNLCSDPDEWGRILLSCDEVLRAQKKKGRPARLRLLANLLIGHENFIKALLQYDDMAFVNQLVDKLCSLINSKAVSTQERNNCLRILLYLLRIRCYDGKRFATAQYDNENYMRMMNICPSTSWRYTYQNSTQQLRGLLHGYLNGEGSLDGIVRMAQTMGDDDE